MLSILKFVYWLVAFMLVQKFFLILDESWNIYLFFLLLFKETLTIAFLASVFDKVTEALTSIALLFFLEQGIFSNASALARVARGAFYSVILPAAITIRTYHLFLKTYCLYQFWVEKSWLQVQDNLCFYTCAIKVHGWCVVWFLMLFAAPLIFFLSSLFPHVEELLVGIVIIIHKSLLTTFPLAPFNFFWVNVLLLVRPVSTDWGKVVIILIPRVLVDQSFVS